MSVITTPPASTTGTRPGLFLVFAATLLGVAINIGLEVLEVVLVPDTYAEFDSGLAHNAFTVVLWSAVGCAIAAGLVRLGAAPSRRTLVAWIAVALALLTALPLFFVAVPASLAAAAYTLGRGRPGSAAAVRVLAIVAFVAHEVVSIGMFPWAEV